MRKLSAIQKFFTQSARSSSQNSAPAASISYVLSVLLYARHAPFNAMLNVSTKSYRKTVLKPVLITLTVKNGSDLAERSEHLMKSFRTLLERRRDYLKKGWGYSEFCKVQGAMYSL